ncbi:CrcB-like protein-domain-containing protein [Microdochium bolleyi]|uniref:CrcB-like protein-domain-containing protein n=1 Tax=Microdochium bolleyi TaxID=196109 RepID=A0A136IUY8_9PEZI|nr:CrcB-like protein-domain-containing protein [Microdochium bolleyi]
MTAVPAEMGPSSTALYPESYPPHGASGSATTPDHNSNTQPVMRQQASPRIQPQPQHRKTTRDGGYGLSEALSSPDVPTVTGHSAPEARLGTPSSRPDDPQGAGPPGQSKPRPLTELYTVSYLVFFAILGTLARLGLQALTSYPGTPTIFSSLWPNFAGCLIMGFLAEDSKLFLHEHGVPRSSPSPTDKAHTSSDATTANDAAAKKAHLAVKKTIPLYIGLATGFCGSFTSFSSFMRDVFLALSNDLIVSGSQQPQRTRNGGYSFMALLAVLIVTIALSLSALFAGAHLAVAVEPYTPSIPFRAMSKVFDRAVVPLAFGCWIGAALLSAVPPDRNDTPPPLERWRGTATFALVFAPLGCLLRFYVSAWLNKPSRGAARFPWGTFAVNILGTTVLGMAWDLQYVPLGGVLGCQVLQGVEDGFCGCLTTVSTWAAELASLRRRRDAYVYGGASVGAGLAVLVVVMGGLRWTDGFAEIQCLH